MGRDPREFHHAVIEAELVTERGSTLGRAGERLAAAIARCHEIRAQLDDDHDHTAADRERVAAEYRVALAEHDDARRTYLIQREALRLLDHRTVDRHFPRPPRSVGP